MASLNDIPFLSGYMQQGQLNRQNELGDLRQAAGAQSLIANMRAQRQAEQEQAEMERIKPLIAQAGGDPTKAIQALLSTGNPKAIELAAKLRGMMPKPAEAYTLAPGAQRRGPNNELVAEAPATPKEEREVNIVRMMRASGIPEGSPRWNQIMDNALRKESETAKQISPTVVMPRPTEPLVPIVGPDGKPTLVTRTEAIGKTPAGAGMEKPLPPNLQKQLSEASELADATNRFKTTYKDSFGGKTLTGDLGNVAGRLLGDDTGQSQWWQDYELHQSQVRNKLFGSALTAPEIEAWNKSAINPRMETNQIRANLNRRDVLEQRAVDRLIKGATAGRYNKDQIEAFTGRSANPPMTPASPQESGGEIGRSPAKISSDAEFDALPSGATFVGPDGKTRKKP